MKNIKIILQKTGRLLMIPVLASGLLFTSCEDEIINLEPFNQISETVAFSSPEYIELSVIGMYNAAQRGTFNDQGRGYPFGAAFVQQGDNRGEDVVNLFAFFQFTYQGTYNTTTANNVFYWIDTYRVINFTNIVIDGVTQAIADGVIGEAQGNNFIGEALLLRAAAYHELLTHFARPYKHTNDASHPGVPYHRNSFQTVGAINDGLQVGRHTVAQCYTWILEDLNMAEQYLPSKAERTGNFKVARGTKGAAAAYKARVHQHMWNMEGVITEGNKFLDGGVYAGQYTLGAEPWTAFFNNFGDEYIFGMASSATNFPSVNGALASMYNRRLLVSHSPINWRNPFWLEDDKRRKEGEMVIVYDSIYYTAKYKSEEYEDVSPMMRYPEVILNVAEAHARLGQTDQALTLLNRVRDRALADKATQSYTAADFASNVELLEAILNERRIEFAMEGRRWPDIHRLQHCPHFPIDGIPGKVGNGVANPKLFLFDGPAIPIGEQPIPYSSHRFLWPIPQQEVNANPVLGEQQNPGY